MRTDDKLDQTEGQPMTRARPRMTRTRLWLFSGTVAVYAAIVVGVLTTSWLVTLDWQVMFFRPYKQWPQIHAFLDYFVVLGQRGPTAVAVAAWLGWRCWRQRNLHPLLVLGASLLLLNVTVGAAKIGMGRLGPHYGMTVGANEMGMGGDIFPSGHTANAVVTWGVLAYLATTPLRRRTLSVVAAVGALGVGMTTVYLGTHWVSDVLLGWAAGLLVLLALPWFEPALGWAEGRLMALWLRLRAGRLLTAGPAAAEPAVRVSGPLPAGATASSVFRSEGGRTLVREAVGVGGNSTPHTSGAPAEGWPSRSATTTARPGRGTEGSQAPKHRSGGAHGPSRSAPLRTPLTGGGQESS
ncbi:phosphatase PAP2 family protein [Streptomyces sp. NPDC059740]|uniref:phosphatase PAP2 family protein n=1 Tax=Streptomyces sp. NPDC059740 TaxID=3346926 RepID=UPI00366468AF